MISNYILQEVVPHYQACKWNASFSSNFTYNNKVVVKSFSVCKTPAFSSRRCKFESLFEVVARTGNLVASKIPLANRLPCEYQLSWYSFPRQTFYSLQLIDICLYLENTLPEKNVMELFCSDYDEWVINTCDCFFLCDPKHEIHSMKL